METLLVFITVGVATLTLIIGGFSLMVFLEALDGDRLEHLEESELDKT
jgi:NhaP-type Na+/H+ or K+/H+ antiporter